MFDVTLLILLGLAALGFISCRRFNSGVNHCPRHTVKHLFPVD